MHTTTLPRPAPLPLTRTAVERPRRPGTTAGRASALVLGVVALLAAAAWSLAAPQTAPPGRAGEVVLDGGVARVDEVASAARPQHAMPGMGTDDDPVADGDRRVSVEVTLQATEDEPLAYAADRFVLAVPGAGPVRPHRSVLPGTELPAGTALSGTLVFDVPRTAGAGELSYDGGPSASVVLPPEAGVPAQGTDQGAEHGGEHG